MSAQATRRSQADRTAETRARLLEATVNALVELGYARTTTVEVVERTGLSRGAMLHHFASRADIVTAAITCIAQEQDQRLRELLVEVPAPQERFSEFIDAVWDVFSGPRFYAALELWVAARTDEELRDSLVVAERAVGRSLRDLAGGLVDADDPRGFAIFELTMAMLRGLAVTAILRGPARAPELIDTWKEIVLPHLQPRGET